MKNRILNNKVFVAALLSAIILVLQQALGNAEFDWKAIGFATLISIIGVVANQWKGQGVTIFGILSTLAGVFHTIYTTGNFTWNEFILSALVAILTAISTSLQPSSQENKTS